MKNLFFTFVFFVLMHFTFAQIVNIDIKVFLEGSFNGTDMNTELNNAGLIPLMQPYNSEPWNYNGLDSVLVIPNGDIVDWVLIELRETSGDASAALSDSIITRQAHFLLKNGQIVDLDGISLPEYDLSISDNLYVVIWHRNHLTIMSATPLIESAGIYYFDFTDDIAKAYGNGQKFLSSGMYGMIGGDRDGNGRIVYDDLDNNWSTTAGKRGYDPSDLNLDTEINNIDKDDYWIENLGLEAKLPAETVFICGDQILDIDGNYYNTVLIGTQCWMAENLKTTSYQNGLPIQNVVDESIWGNLTTGAYVWYDNDISWKDSYGALYNWHAVNDPNELCPSGWHVPANDEWTELTDFIGGTSSPHGNELKSCRQVNSPLGGDCNTADHPRWNEDTSNGHYGTDNYGFSGLPGGYRINLGSFTAIGGRTYWWATTSISSNSVWSRYLYVNDDNIGSVGIGKNIGVSVRCLRD